LTSNSCGRRECKKDSLTISCPSYRYFLLFGNSDFKSGFPFYFLTGCLVVITNLATINPPRLVEAGSPRLRFAKAIARRVDGF